MCITTYNIHICTYVWNVVFIASECEWVCVCGRRIGTWNIAEPHKYNPLALNVWYSLFSEMGHCNCHDMIAVYMDGAAFVDVCVLCIPDSDCTLSTKSMQFHILLLDGNLVVVRIISTATMRVRERVKKPSKWNMCGESSWKLCHKFEREMHLGDSTTNLSV